MKNKEFEKIMQAYVSSKAPSTDECLEKLRTKPQPQKRRNCTPRMAWAAFSAILIMCVSLAVALPLVLKPSEPDNSIPDTPLEMPDDTVITPVEPTYTFSDSGDFTYTKMEAGVNLKETYGLTADVINIVAENKITYLLKAARDEQKEFGFTEQADVFNFGIFSILTNVIKNNYSISLLAEYENLTNTIEYNGVTVKYYSTINEIDGCTYEHKIFFTKGGYKYYLDVSCYEDLEITELLDLIY